MEIKTSLNYEFDPNYLSNLDVPSNVWVNRGQCSAVYRTNKGTGSIHTSDCIGSYDENGVYQSVWYEIEWTNGNWTSSCQATSWENAKSKIEDLLND